jgi:hypothetical protein
MPQVPPSATPADTAGVVNLQACTPTGIGPP